jgi:hypothetical protein
LSLDITGVNGQRAFLTDCKAASVTGSFTAQGGQTHTATAPITFTGQCPSSTGTGTGTGVAKPPVSPPKSKPKPKSKAAGSVTGLVSGHPRLKLKVTGPPAAKIASVAVGLPSGLRFARSAFVSHKVCVKKGTKKKCTTTKRVKGLRISGRSAKAVVLKSGRLVITLKKAATSLTITAARPLVIESKSLDTKVKHHKAGTLRFTLKVTTANHASTSLTLKLKAH